MLSSWIPQCACLTVCDEVFRYSRKQSDSRADMGVMLNGAQCLQVYVHCTAGLGRAPAACIAWMYWFGDRQLDEVGADTYCHGPNLIGSPIQSRNACAVHHIMTVVVVSGTSGAVSHWHVRQLMRRCFFAGILRADCDQAMWPKAGCHPCSNL